MNLLKKNCEILHNPAGCVIERIKEIAEQWHERRVAGHVKLTLANQTTRLRYSNRSSANHNAIHIN